jgi:hypothetical protein
MKPLPELPDLKIIETDCLQPHEYIDEKRVKPLIQALRKERILRNPPLVLPISGRGGRHVVLDGANRTMAFQKMGLPHVVVQVVHAGGNEVRVETWNHAVLGMPARELLERLGLDPRMVPLKSSLERAAAEVRSGAAVAYVSLPDGSVWQVDCTCSNTQERLACLTALVSNYLNRARIERVNVIGSEALAGIYGDLAGVVVFPRFDVQDVIDVAASGGLFPSGLTRFIVSPRALRLNYPLEALSRPGPVEEKQQALDAWIREAVARRGVRYYAEATFLFDE